MDAEAGDGMTDERRSEIAARLSWGWRDWYEKVLDRQSADWDATALEFFEQAAAELLAERTQLLADLEEARQAREIDQAHSALDAAGIPRETAAGPWPLERRVRLLAAWWQESQGVAELNPELVAERERLRSTIDALVSGLESPSVVAVRILARLAGEPGCVIPGEERLVGVVCAAMEREGAGG